MKDLVAGKVSQDIDQLLRKRLDVLSQTPGRGQPLKAQSLREKRLVAVVTEGIKLGIARRDQSDNRADDVDVRNPVFSLCLRGRPMPKWLCNFCSAS